VQWLCFALLVIGSSVASFVFRERRFRRRWQSVELPATTVGVGAYRQGLASGAMMPSAPLALRIAALSCIIYGRGVTWALITTALYLAGVPVRAVAEATLHGLLGYLAGGYGVGALAAILLAALGLGAGNDLLLRNHRHAFRRTRNIAVASLALHGLVWANITFHGHVVASTAREVAASLNYARFIAAAAFGHAALMLGLAHAYRAQLSALSPAERALEA
jgi:hypothetical protein